MRRRDARATLLCFLAGFAMLQLGLAGLIAWRMPDVRDPLYHERAARVPARPRVVFLGTSRAAEGFRAEVVQRELFADEPPGAVYNFGVPGSGPISRLLFLRRMLASGVRPALVLIEFFPATLNEVGLRAEMTRLTGGRLDGEELRLVAGFGDAKEDRVAAWLRSWLVPWYEHRYVLVMRLSRLFDPYRGKGVAERSFDAWGQERPRPDMTSAEQERGRAEAAEEYARVFRGGYTLSEPICRAYREMLELCRREGIPAALVWMPEGPTFRSCYPRGAMGTITGVLDGLRAEFGVPVINAREWIDEEDFRDSHHLLPRGAVRFSEKLVGELRPLVAGEGTR